MLHQYIVENNIYLDFKGQVRRILFCKYFIYVTPLCDNFMTIVQLFKKNLKKRETHIKAHVSI